MGMLNNMGGGGGSGILSMLSGLGGTGGPLSMLNQLQGLGNKGGSMGGMGMLGALGSLGGLGGLGNLGALGGLGGLGNLGALGGLGGLGNLGGLASMLGGMQGGAKGNTAGGAGTANQASPLGNIDINQILSAFGAMQNNTKTANPKTDSGPIYDIPNQGSKESSANNPDLEDGNTTEEEFNEDSYDKSTFQSADNQQFDFMSMLSGLMGNLGNKQNVHSKKNPNQSKPSGVNDCYNCPYHCSRYQKDLPDYEQVLQLAVDWRRY